MNPEASAARPPPQSLQTEAWSNRLLVVSQPLARLLLPSSVVESKRPEVSMPLVDWRFPSSVTHLPLVLMTRHLPLGDPGTPSWPAPLSTQPPVAPTVSQVMVEGPVRRARAVCDIQCSQVWQVRWTTSTPLTLA